MTPFHWVAAAGPAVYLAYLLVVRAKAQIGYYVSKKHRGDSK